MKDIEKVTGLSKPIVIGVGASAGGLEAFQLFLTGLPDDHSLVIVLVQHLDPHHESLMPELVAAKTKSPVHSVTDKMRIQPGHIYLLPPGFEMEISDDLLSLKEFASPRGLRRPIDRFFKSLATSYGENAIAVVLSGTGSDGADGAREVKGAGGLVLVQDPKQAKYDGMPRSVLDQSGADVVSKAEEIVYVVRDYFSLRVGITPDVGSDEEFVGRIMRHVRFRTGHDFTDYKRGTTLRRIAVRMSVLNISDPSDYLTYLVENKSEADLLFRDLLINVTSFFRDMEHFELLRTTIIPDIVDRVDQHGEIRVWVAGCSTGEEAYSIGILFAEEVNRTSKHCSIVVFGTDIDDQALATARLGKYSDTIVESVPAAYLDRYFRPTHDGYEVGPRLREIVRFSRHSFIKDPPFSKLDMVSCRNVMIYLKDNLQDLTCTVFHYALVQEGYLFIGPSEHPKHIHHLFTEIAARERIFKRRPGQAKPLNLGSLSGKGLTTETIGNDPERVKARQLSEVERTLMANHLPAYLHIDHKRQVIFSSENAIKYLSIRSGNVSTDLFSVIAPELETAVRRVFRVDDAADAADAQNEREFQGEINGNSVRIILRAHHLSDDSVVLVINDRLDLKPERPGETTDHDKRYDNYVRTLEAELDDARQKVRSTVEELETSNEELKSSNEEMMSMNEELQSANEELTTINDEIQEKLRELNQVNLDLNNFVQSTRVATVFLDEDLRLLRYTPEAEHFFSFKTSDMGRRIEDLTSEINQDILLSLCQETMLDKVEREHEFPVRDGIRSLKVQIMPYSPEGKNSVGVVFTLLDVTELREAIETAEALTKIAEERLNEVEQVYKTSPMAMGMISRDMRYIRLNEQLANVHEETLEWHLNRTIREVIPSVADHVEKLVGTVFDTGTAIRGENLHGTTRRSPHDMRIWESDWVPFYYEGEITGVSVNLRDITEQVETADSLRRIMRELDHRVKNMLSNVMALLNRAKAEAKSDEDVYIKLTNRIQAIAKTHALLTSEHWSSARLIEIITPETVDVHGADRTFLKGPDLKVNSQTTLALGMTIHELATNAAKYGAFSTAEGTVSITWARINDAAGDRLVIDWVEKGGPKIKKPKRIGFGSQLIASTIEGTLEGKSEAKWLPSGLAYRFELDFTLITRNSQGWTERV